MKKCKCCGEEFKTTVIIEGKRRFLSGRKYCLTCSPFNMHNTRTPKVNLKDGYRICSECNRELPKDRFWKRTKNLYQSRCKDCLYEYQQKRRTLLKNDAIKYKGGKCVICGYNKCNEALDFHHLNPDKKDFNISHIKSRTLNSLISELDKCILLCSNCHRELHGKGLIHQ